MSDNVDYSQPRSAAASPSPQPCRPCGGTGAVDVGVLGRPSSFLSVQAKCPACGGRGTVGYGYPDAALDVGQGGQGAGLPGPVSARVAAMRDRMLRERTAARVADLDRDAQLWHDHADAAGVLA